MAVKQISDLSIAVLVPCYNEGATIGTVVEDFKAALPDATIYVYDNRSTDDTVERAQKAGAIVRSEERPGKGEVVRRMFGDIEADIYVMVDGDATYHAASAPALIDLMLKSHADLVNGARVDTAIKAYRPGHRFGNRLLTGLVSAFFGQMTTDMLSGYKMFSRRFVKSFPAHSRGFEIETELMVHALELRMTIKEKSTPYVERPEGSISKLNTVRDGIRIVSIIGLFVREERPLAVFSLLGLILSGIALILGIPVVVEFLHTGLVSRFPTAILASALMITAVISVFSGLVLDTVTRGRREAKRFAYLAARDRRFE
ncbi:glycosyltransferase family 2 protein [Candidatus Phycosocius spiralis]|uniref:Glycosyl transferase n=1 Tax=Candidatus Phycosocius spiralis TaxID=2815099 RepID=A0ABQ4PXD2_9PROT|nr:glycosyltransferase family 2 protein [Candidatus Phycosocius spiralis]GIU67697.1 glycosyl transferase [Candidatus Phycosocius spiralis]